MISLTEKVRVQMQEKVDVISHLCPCGRIFFSAGFSHAAFF